ncbi:LysR family transcriptional regulator [Lactobacillus sp. ESL0791]|uniref:LysR substrate-binding domain-containing protein n=1 Tax=Lactobacillus sp. ESL0791 TaxID=2983234 RepID=UPI0023F807F9|nr:LysR family transcriptional regulator [Lactobacillus sp. ESL0791]MDF7638895.1 LysR family transcriptional regulator [Lactobacillus sp. ESL0791]
MPKTEKIFSAKSLHYFLQLIDTMNYTQAAQILGITQPALTQQIKKLERTIGVPLFGQIGKKLYLTEAGKQLQTGAIRLLDTINSVVDDIQEFTQADKGTITIGMLENITTKILHLFLADFSKRFPDIKIKVRYFKREDLWHELDNNLIDLAIMYLPDNTKKNIVDLQQQYRYSEIYKDRIVVLTHKKDLESGKTYPVSALKDRKWVAYPEEFYLSQLMRDYFGNKHKMDVPISFSSTEQLVSTAEGNDYDTFINESYYEAHKKEITLTPVYLKPEKDFSVSLVYRKGKREVPRIENILAEFKNFLDNYKQSSKLEEK